MRTVALVPKALQRLVTEAVKISMKPANVNNLNRKSECGLVPRIEVVGGKTTTGETTSEVINNKTTRTNKQKEWREQRLQEIISGSTKRIRWQEPKPKETTTTKHDSEPEHTQQKSKKPRTKEPNTHHKPRTHKLPNTTQAPQQQHFMYIRSTDIRYRTEHQIQDIPKITENFTENTENQQQTTITTNSEHNTDTNTPTITTKQKRKPTSKPTKHNTKTTSLSKYRKQYNKHKTILKTRTPKHTLDPTNFKPPKTPDTDSIPGPEMETKIKIRTKIETTERIPAKTSPVRTTSKLCLPVPKTLDSLSAQKRKLQEKTQHPEYQYTTPTECLHNIKEKTLLPRSHSKVCAQDFEGATIVPMTQVSPLCTRGRTFDDWQYQVTVDDAVQPQTRIGSNPETQSWCTDDSLHHLQRKSCAQEKDPG